MKTIHFSIFLFLISLTSSSQTIVNGGVVSGNWTVSGSPYLIQGAIMISDGNSLIIDPGVTVDFQGSYKFVVLGKLTAVGNINDSITFTATDTSTGWLGIRFDSTLVSNDSSIFDYCRFFYGKANGTAGIQTGGALYFKYFSKLRISNSRFSGCYASNNGGAIEIINSNPLIKFNEFSNNSAEIQGGAISSFSSNPQIIHNFFHNNFGVNSVAMGGALSMNNTSTPLVDSNIFKGNRAYRGGSIFCLGTSSEIKNNSFEGGYGPVANSIFCEYSNSNIHHNNFTANDSGYVLFMETGNTHFHHNEIMGNNSGGISFISNSTCIIEDNIIYNNKGSGLRIIQSPITVRRNIISNNESKLGGGIYCWQPTTPQTIISNNMISNNTATQSGGAIYCRESNSLFASNTIVNNFADTAGAVYLYNNSDPTIINSIIYGNEGNIADQVYLFDETSDPNIEYSDIENGQSAILTNSNVFFLGSYLANIDSNPLFVQPTLGSGINYNGSTADFRISGGSPCIDAGGAPGNYSPTDLFGNPRITGGTIDMGAYEFTTTGIKEINTFLSVPNPLTGTFNFISPGITSVQLINIQGKIVYSSSETQINSNDFCNGVYCLVLKNSEAIKTIKILIYN